MSILGNLQARGLIHQTTLQESTHLDVITGVYSGFEPSAASLHVGNLLPLITLARFSSAGFPVTALLGGATALIGDPSGKNRERTLLDSQTIQQNINIIKDQISWLFRRIEDSTGHSLSFQIQNNLDWLSKINCLDYLRDIGKHFTVPYMLAKESVASRLETGISYTEFSYMLLQAEDFRHLAKTNDINLQIGGSDQWGNIIAGIDLCQDRQLYALTIPLLLNKDGSKFGKTAEGAVYLNSKMTRVYDFRQFWYNTPDAELESRFLQFTFFKPGEIKEICKDAKSAQQQLADEMTRMIHGVNAVALANSMADVLYGTKELTDLPETLQQDMIDNLDKVKLTQNSFSSPVQLVSDAFYHGEKRGQSRRDLEAGSISCNRRRITPDSTLERLPLIQNKYGFLRRGRAGVCFEIINDDMCTK